jgi:hypothetical protein
VSGLKPMSPCDDTDPAAAEFQLLLLRRAGVAGRLRVALALSASVIDLARDGIRNSLPGASDEEVGLRFVELHYGADLARDVRAYLARLHH